MNNLWIIDTFTDVAFRGNPAAVYLLDGFYDDKSLQLLAEKANLSETAFVVEVAPLDYDLRWFTPTTEVELCGHATLASAHVLAQIGKAKIGDVISFNTRSGELKATILKKGIQLDFPTLAGTSAIADPALSALGVAFTNCQKNRDDYLVEVADFNTLITMRPNMDKLTQLKARGVIVTTNKNVTDFDFASRFFAPSSGINEDPVTGSAHCFLAPYWAKKLGKTSFHALQASSARGILDVELHGDRTLITGSCVTTIKGNITLSRKSKQKQKKEISA